MRPLSGWKRFFSRTYRRSLSRMRVLTLQSDRRTVESTLRSRITDRHIVSYQNMFNPFVTHRIRLTLFFDKVCNSKVMFDFSAVLEMLKEVTAEGSAYKTVWGTQATVSKQLLILYPFQKEVSQSCISLQLLLISLKTSKKSLTSWSLKTLRKRAWINLESESYISSG